MELAGAVFWEGSGCMGSPHKKTWNFLYTNRARQSGKKRNPNLIRGFQMGVFVSGGNLNNWGRPRTGCNNLLCVKSL